MEFLSIDIIIIFFFVYSWIDAIFGHFFFAQKFIKVYRVGFEFDIEYVKETRDFNSFGQTTNPIQYWSNILRVVFNIDRKGKKNWLFIQIIYNLAKEVTRG